MTAPLLLACICAALLFQLAVGIGVMVWRRRGVAAKTPAAEGVQTLPVSSGAWPGWREFRVLRREFEDDTHTQCSFYLEPADGAALPPFRAGQFLTFMLQVVDAGAPGGQRMITRCYSLSDRPEPTCYRITIKRIPAPADRPEVPPGAASSHFHDRIREGDVLQVKAPSGHFFIDPDPQVPAVFIAGGIGITPMMSMLRWCLAEQPERTLHLYYGVRQGGEHAFKLQLEQLANSHPNFRLSVVYSRPGPNDVLERDYQHAGHVDIDLLRRTLPHGRHQFYVCGPAAMMESLVPALARWGVPLQDIHFEAFGPASVRLPGATPQAQPAGLAAPLAIHFRRSGRTLMWDGQDETLLDFAERHGVAVDSGCRSGSCGSCETKLLSGRVRYANPPEHDIAPGHCLLCVGMPESALEIEA
ncbi:2Fe-2S iron-sulfur cluster-binding protein [Rhodoferax sp.]|uniref:2Fe-2S iron-sulfur cluster-binding protein n=1 Tax=Rhodoferax sp. TaxID=50421 RepID=UPI0025DA6561|nr:2Fe-2S iron-sulfur cluster-binding protein [Rhodoferax sp.]